MRILAEAVLLAAALALGACAGAHPARPAQSVPVPVGAEQLAATRPAVERMLAAEVARLALPSLAVGVVTKSGLVYFVGLGERDADHSAVTQDTVFRIGSVTKTITGVAILELRDAGKLDLDDPVVKYLPELASARAPTSDSGPIRIRHLVTHSSGLPRVGTLDYGSGHELTRLDLREAAASAVLEFAPGTRASYSNLAMALAGPLIARVSGEPYRAYVERHILAPLGMTATVWEPEAVPADRLARGWATSGAGFSPCGAHWRLGAAEAMGGLYSSVADLARYLAFQLSAWPARDGADDGPLRRSSLRESQLIAGFARPGSGGFGVNWIVRRDARLGHVVFHNGATEGYHTTVLMLPERGLGVVALGPSSDQIDGIAHRALEIALTGVAADAGAAHAGEGDAAATAPAPAR